MPNPDVLREKLRKLSSYDAWELIRLAGLMAGMFFFSFLLPL
ncbi:MAG: hypothetical protein R2688_00475 [Fimbriimonadaceae bacterium]